MRAIRVVEGFSGELLDTVTLDFDARFRRRVAMVGDQGTEFLLDLPKVVGLAQGDALELEDGHYIGVVAAAEPLMQVCCDDQLHLAKAAWHVGNRHLPCEIHVDKLVLRTDHVIADMLRKLGCTVEDIVAPFNPEGGAYGAGRTHGHSHGTENGHHHHD